MLSNRSMGGRGWVAASLIFAAQAAHGQTLPKQELAAAKIVARAVQNRHDAETQHKPLQFMLLKIDGEHDTTKLIVETKDGDVARLLARDGKPVTVEDTKAELTRLQTLAAHPEQEEKRHKSEQADAARVTDVLSYLPVALLYHIEGTEPCGASQCYRMAFTPSPLWKPPTMESRVLRGTAGELWIDTKAEQLVKLNAHFVSEVDFGLGLLGKINKGGHVLLEQSDTGGGDWELTRLEVSLGGKALLVKTIYIELSEQMSKFAPVPIGMDYRQAIELLEKAAPAMK